MPRPSLRPFVRCRFFSRCPSQLVLGVLALAAAFALALPIDAHAQRRGGGGGGRGGRGGRAGGKGVPAAAKPNPTATTPRPPAVYKPKNNAALAIRYQIVEGGGVPDTVVVIRGDGAVRYKKGDDVRQIRLKKPQMAGLKALLHKAGFRTLHATYGDHALDPDPKSKTVVLKSKSHLFSVQDFLDPENSPGPAFRKLTDTLDKLVKRLTKAPSPKIPFSGVGITVQTDRNVYAAAATGPAPAMWAALAVSNSADEPLAIDFPTAQKYDFAIRDAKGDEVYRWSKGREFDAKAPRTLRVDRGGVHYVERIPLATSSGAPLGAGEYVLEWRFCGNPQAAGEILFEIAEPAGPARAESTTPSKAKPQQKQPKGPRGGARGAGRNRPGAQQE